MAKPQLMIVKPGNDSEHVAVYRSKLGWRQYSLVGFQILRAYLDSRNQELFHG